MLHKLSEKFFNIFKNIRYQGYISENSIHNTVRDVRRVLLEADVELSLVKVFINQVKNEILGKEINKSLTPGQEFIKILYKVLVSILGKNEEKINLSTIPPAIIFIIGLQGSGKTISTVKLGEYFYIYNKRKSLVTSVDIYRPAAIKQLKVLTKNTHVKFLEINYDNLKPKEILKKAINNAKSMFYDILIVDTVGCSTVNKNLISEIFNMQKYSNPIETLFVIDSMIGQEASKIIKSFSKLINITGIILTKTDGDIRGGAALSIRYATGLPIKFIGTGEKINDIQKFFPERFASSILGMGDIISLIENIEYQNKKSKINNSICKINKFDLHDFLKQIQQIRNIGGIHSIIKKLPINNSINLSKLNMNDLLIKRMEAIINSMTYQERSYPELIKGSRKRRIAFGSGVNIQEVNKLLKYFNEMKKFMKTMKRNRLISIPSNIKKFIFRK